MENKWPPGRGHFDPKVIIWTILVVVHNDATYQISKALVFFPYTSLWKTSDPRSEDILIPGL